jgi:inner membrane protein
MPSPIAHLSAGYVIYRFMRRKLSPETLALSGTGLLLLLICLFFSMAPDLDALLGFSTGDMGRYHNQWSHSIAFAIAVAALAAVIMRRWKGSSFRSWLALFLACYGTHILMDFFTYGRGVRLFWPVDPARCKPPHSFFGGLRWSEGFFSSAHINTAIEELSFAAIIIGLCLLVEILTGNGPFKSRSRSG